ncbi:MAG: hypothetical protein AAF226_10925, partial [Verrucomicrobiota bacterium]
AFPASFAFGVRSFLSDRLPAPRNYKPKGIKLRFFYSRGIGLTAIFIILNATTLNGYSWMISKTVCLLPAIFVLAFTQPIFFILFRKNPPERMAQALPIFAVMATMIATQACEQYTLPQVILISIAIVLSILLYLRKGPLTPKYWDPICSFPVFLLGGSLGTIAASCIDDATLLTQLLGVATALGLAAASAALLSKLLPRKNVLLHA